MGDLIRLEFENFDFVGEALTAVARASDDVRRFALGLAPLVGRKEATSEVVAAYVRIQEFLTVFTNEVSPHTADGDEMVVDVVWWKHGIHLHVVLRWQSQRCLIPRIRMHEFAIANDNQPSTRVLDAR